MGEIILRVVEQHVAEPAADDDAEGAIDQQIVDALGARPLGARPSTGRSRRPANQQPSENKPGDIGERIPADGQRPPLHEDRIDCRERAGRGSASARPDALASGSRQGRAAQSWVRHRLDSVRDEPSLWRGEPLVDRSSGFGDRLQRIGQVVDAELPRAARRSRSTARPLRTRPAPRRRRSPVGPAPRTASLRRTGCRRPRRAPSACRADRPARPGSRSPAVRGRAGRRRGRTVRPARAGRSRRA